MYDAPDFAFQAFGHALLALAFGAALMVAATLVVERLMTQAAMRRVLWQATLVGLCALFAFELSGTSHALSSLFARSSHPTASKTDIQAAPISLDDSLIPQAADSALGPPYALYDLPTISMSHAPPLHPDYEDRTYLEPVPIPTDSAKTLSATLPSAPRQFLAEPTLQVDTAQKRVPSRSFRRQTVGNVAPRATSPARPQAPVSVAAIPESKSESLAATILVLLWLVGTCALGGRAVVARVKLSRQRWQWHTNEEPNLEQLVESLSHRIGMKRTVRIRVTNGLPTPVAFGILRPTVLVPTDFTKRFSDAQQQVILAHELAHLAGSDPAWLFASELVTALMWWHPLAHVARRRLLAASEQAADEACVIVPGGPDVLAECLVKLGRRLTGKPRLGWVAAEGSGLRSGLARRVQQLLKLSDRPAHHVARRAPGASRPLAVVLLMILTISCTLWVHPKTSFAKGEETMNVLRGSWRQSLAAVALTAFLGSLSTDAAADEKPDVPPKPAQLEDGSPVDQVLIAQRGEREVREPRERGARDAEHREREGREHHERGERERDAEHRERGPRERAQREGEEHRERLAEEREELRQRAEEIEHEKAEFQRDAEQEARELEEGIRETQEEIEELERHFVELEETLDELRKNRAEEADDDDEDEELEEIDEAIADVCEELEGAREERAELAERSEELKREMRELQVNVRRRMAELDREFAVIRAQLARMEAAGRENPERGGIRGRIAELMRELTEAIRANKHVEASRLQADINELHERLEGMERQEAMERELHKLREAGQHERAERLEGELHELHRRLHAPRDGDRPGPPPELQARIDHLHAAMENLHAAGLHEQAEQIAQQIERIMHEHDPDARPPHEGRPEPGHEIVGQLRGEIEQLRRENEEMRRMMQEIREAQEGFMKELREREYR